MYDIGGVRNPRPFKIRRVSHIGLNSIDTPAMLHCYRDLLGLVTTDESQNLANRLDPDRSLIPEEEARPLYFFRYGGDHHQFVLMDRRLWSLIDPEHAHISINQFSWQIGSLQEISDSIQWLGGEEQRILRAGRDMPGSNWHTYVLDPLNGFTFELTFGMEQVGWDRLSKPQASWEELRFHEFPQLPHQSEQSEIAEQKAKGVDVAAGFEPPLEVGPYVVGGIPLPRPFKIVGLGPFAFIVDDVDASAAYYQQKFGFELRYRASVNGVEFAALACNAAHHAFVLYGPGARSAFGLAPDANLVGTGFQLASYRQLRDAVAFLTEQGLEEVDVPGELVPGFDHVAHLRDPDGNLIQLYFQMRQCIGDDARAGRPSITGPASSWPELIDPADDTFYGEVFMGPWA